MLAFGSLFIFYGYEKTWRLWSIPTMSPHFADIRVITGGAESYAQGLDPMIENPGDPWQRRLNYPRVWQNLYSLGVNQSHTTYIGIGVILSFFVGVCLILPHASNFLIALVMAAVLSPAALLGIERGNIDLLMFFLVSISVVTVKRWRVLSTVAVLLGFSLKLFPIFGGTVLLKVSRSLFLRYVLIIYVFATLYTFLIYSDILLIIETTPKSVNLSYGINVFWMKAMQFNSSIGELARFLSPLTVLLALGWAFIALPRNDFVPESQSEAVCLDAFRAGAAIYLGTFLLGNNWDYRLIFLILTMPQLVAWVQCRSRYISLISIFSLASILLSLWNLVIARIARQLPYGNYASFVLDEISNWVVFIGLLYLLFWSMPYWVKGYGQKIEFLTRRFSERS